MKYLIMLMLFISFACNKDKTDEAITKIEEYPNDIYLDKDAWLPGAMTEGFMQAKKNGVVWKASAKGAMFNARFWVFAYTFNSKNFERESFSFSDIPYIHQRYAPYLKSIENIKQIETTFYRLAADGDVIANLPHLVVDTTVSTNYIDVISIDTISNVMEARFDVSFISAPNEKKEKMCFSEGYVKVKIKKW